MVTSPPTPPETRTLTRQRRLHALQPLWAATPNITVPVAPRPSHTDYDVIVVGAGISGALTALALAKAGRRVLVCDRRAPARGSSLASTAMIQHEIDVPLHRLARAIGKAEAVRVWQRSVRAVDDLATLVNDLDITCSFERRQTLYLAGDDAGSRALATEAEMREAAGLHAEYLDAGALRDRFGLDRTAAIVSSPSASANPAQMTAGILREAQANGAEIVAPLEITDCRETGAGVVLATSDGRLLGAGDVVFCTGYEFLKPLAGRSHRIASTWALASRPGLKRPRWLDDVLVWEASDPYLYFRTTPDGRLIAGGEDETDPEAYRDEAKARKKFARIADKIHALTGISIGTPAYSWAAPFGTTMTGLPIIDRAPGQSHTHVVMGFGGNGITFSTIASQLIAARIAGKDDPDSGLFRNPG